MDNCYKHDSSIDHMIQFNITFGKTFFLELKETLRQVVSNFLCGNDRRDMQLECFQLGIHYDERGRPLEKMSIWCTN